MKTIQLMLLFFHLCGESWSFTHLSLNRNIRSIAVHVITQRKSQNTNQDGSSEEPSILPNILNPSKKQFIRKKREGEAASAAMDLPDQPIVKTIPGGVDAIFRSARNLAASSAPRWHPPQESQERAMKSPTSKTLSSSAAAALIWRNARKRNKPALWRYALRTIDRVPTPTKIHYEGALVAAAHLGNGKRALELYDRVLESPVLHVTDNMVLSLTRACAKSDDPVVRERLVGILQDHRATAAMHWNPLAAAGVTHGDAEFARAALDNLPDRRPQQLLDDEDRFHVDDVHAKDGASYAIAVNVAVGEKDWGAAVGALRNMTVDAGLVPTRRQWHRWTELGE